MKPICFSTMAFVLAFGLPVGASETTDAGGGCQYDTQCKGNRICEENRCVESTGGFSAPPQPVPLALGSQIRTPARSAAISGLASSIPGALTVGLTEIVDQPGPRLGMLAGGIPLLAIGVPIASVGIANTRKNWTDKPRDAPISKAEKAAWTLYGIGMVGVGSALALTIVDQIEYGDDYDYWSYYLPLYGTAAGGSVVLLAATGLMAKVAFDEHRDVVRHAICPKPQVSLAPQLSLASGALTYGFRVSW